MDYKELSDLIELIDNSDLSEFKMEDGDFKLRIRTDKYVSKDNSGGGDTQIVPMPQSMPAPQGQPAPQPQQSPQSQHPKDSQSEDQDDGGAESGADSDNLLEVKSPIVGTFYRSPSPEKPPYIKVGDQINEGDVVCIVEAMKLFNEIESEVTGKVVKVLVEDAAPVEYDQALFLVDPEG